jgi:biotin operon repressor
MEHHIDARAIEHAAVLLKVGGRNSGDELDAALGAARHAIECSLQEINDEGGAGRTLIETIDAARSIVRHRA